MNNKFEIKQTNKFYNITADSKLFHSNLSIRIINRLKAYQEYLNLEINQSSKVSELSKLSISKFEKYPYVGKATIKEIIELCLSANVRLLE